MIIEGMTTQEIYNEFNNDLKSVVSKYIHLFPEMRRIAIKSKSKICKKIINYTSPRKNKWIIILTHNIKGATAQSCCYYYNKQGLNLMLPNIQDGIPIHYTPHFLTRYKERFLINTNLNCVDLIIDFIQNNPINVISIKKGEVFGSFNQGVGLGEIEMVSNNNLLIHFKTYVSENMLKGKQIITNHEQINKINEHLSELPNKVKINLETAL